MTTLEQLPDDVLVAVMQYLSVDDLLACRLVCKGLGAVALHPDAWRDRSLTEDKPCVCALVRLAPCLESAAFSDKVHSLAFSTTRCALRELVLDVRVKEKHILFAERALVVLRNQVALGRLRRVVLGLSFSKSEGYAAVNPVDLVKQTAAVDALLNSMVLCSDLESIYLPFGMDEPYKFSPVLGGPSRPSLKSFRCQLHKHSEKFINTVLAGHADTLEEVDLTSGVPYIWDFFYRDTAGLLPGLSKLWRLNCTLFPGMQNLTACKMLRDLSITMDQDFSGIGIVIEEAAAVLRGADRLRSLSIRFLPFGDGPILNNLLKVLPPGLERLSLHSMATESVQPLVRRLPRLRALRNLEISMVFDDVIQGLLPKITPRTAPALRRLELAMVLSIGLFCQHPWLHGDALTTFSSKNPLVHIHLQEFQGCNGEFCENSCPEDSGVCDIPEGQRVGLFAHGPGDCPSPEDHPTGSAWTWKRMRGGSS